MSRLFYCFHSSARRKGVWVGRSWLLLDLSVTSVSQASGYTLVLVIKDLMAAVGGVFLAQTKQTGLREVISTLCSHTVS